MQTIDISESFTYFGLEPGVKAKTIKEAYRRYVKEFHPDLFPKGSDEQQMAAEKLIEANMHFKKLNQYLEFIKANKPEKEEKELPKPIPPKEEPKTQNDWVDWEKERHEAWDTELRDWIALNRKAETDKVSSRSKRDKKILVYSVRAFVVIATFVMWSGYFQENAAIEAKQAERQERLQSAANTGNAVELQWAQHTMQVEDHGFGGFDSGAHWDDRAREQPGKIVPMLFWTVIGIAVLFSNTAKNLANKLLEKPGTTIALNRKEA